MVDELDRLQLILLLTLTKRQLGRAHNPEVVGSKHRSPTKRGYGVFCFPREWVCAIRKYATWTKHGLWLSWQTRLPPACCAARETTTAHRPETIATVDLLREHVT